MFRDTPIRDVSVGPHCLKGRLAVPAEARGMIVFAHGSGSSRNSPREQFVADSLVQRGFATLLFDLLGEVEARDRANVFDINLLARRLYEALAWVDDRPELRGLPTGLFGASTGAAAALVTAAKAPERVSSVVSRGGRPDLADDALRRVQAPVLLIVGGADDAVLDMNEAALAHLGPKSRLEVVPHAGHLFEESGALERVATLAGDWFEANCPAPAAT
jgi:putative phosphoribosyl transferase